MNKYCEWLLLIILAGLGVFSWCQLAYPRYKTIDLSISRDHAFDIAQRYIDQRGIDTHAYLKAISFNVDYGTDRYLQRTLGAAASQHLIQSLHYDLFYWMIRYFKEKQKEEYRVAVSSTTGQIIGYSHAIEDTASRPFVTKEAAEQMSFKALQNVYGFDRSEFVLHSEDEHKYDNRLEYSFTWEKKGMEIPWSKDKKEGYAKLLTNAAVSGNEVMAFGRYQFEVPEGFNRYVDNLKQTGESLTLVFRILYLALITFSIVAVVNRKQQVVARLVKPFYVGVGIVMCGLMITDILNSYQDILFEYPTTQSLADYMIRQFIEDIIGPFFVAIGFILPALAGESLRFEVSADEKQRGILNALLGSFFSVNVARQVFIGYLGAVILLGLQAVIFSLGFKYCGVWDELTWLTQASTSVVPAFSALVIGFQASFSEESMFRMFAINFLRKHGVPMAAAVFLSAAMWGFGHTGYAIYPMWFRGIEVTTVGLVMGFFYLRYGIICVIVTHYLIDSFLNGMPYLLKPRPSFDFYSSLIVVLVPLILGLLFWVFNKNASESPMSVRFNPQQQFNYQLLLELCRKKSSQELTAFKKDLEHHGWDAAIIQRVFEELR